MSQAGNLFNNSGPGGFIQTISGNDGLVVVPTAGNIQLLGTGNITTSRTAVSTEQIALTGTTNHAVQVGNALGSLTSLGLGLTGQVLTGVTGADPVFAAPAASSITITGDSGGALTGSSFTFTGGTTGLTFSGAGTTETLTGTLVVSNGGTGRATLTNHGVLVGAGTTAITQLAVGTNGQVLIGSSAADPVFGTLTSPNGSITFTLGAGSLGLDTTGAASLTWSIITADQSAVSNKGYFCNKAGTLALSLPATSAVGDVIEVANENTALGIQFTQAAGQQILIGSTNTTSGATGTLTTTAVGDTLKIVCKVANLTWRVTSQIGSFTIV